MACGDAAAAAAGHDDGPLPHPVYHSSPRRHSPPPPQSPFVPRHHSLPIRRDRGKSRSPPPARQHSAPVPLHSHPPQPHPPPPPQPPAIPPDLLTLDMRCYAKLEDAIAQVSSYLENVRQLAMERGLVGCDEGGGRNPGGFRNKLFVAIVTGSDSAGTFLRTILQKILLNRHIHFVDRGGEHFDVDALSGTIDGNSIEGEEGPGASFLDARPTHPESSGALGPAQRLEERPSNEGHPQHGGHSMDEPPLSPRRQELMRMQGEVLQQDFAAGARKDPEASLAMHAFQTVLPPPQRDAHYEPSLSPRHQELMRMHAGLLHPLGHGAGHDKQAALSSNHPELTTSDQEVMRMQAEVLLQQHYLPPFPNQHTVAPPHHLHNTNNEQPPLSQRHQELLMMQTESLQRDSASRSPDRHSVSPHHQDVHNEPSLSLRHQELTMRQAQFIPESTSGNCTPTLTAPGKQDADDGEPPLSPRYQELMRIQMRIQAELSQHGSDFFSEGLEPETPMAAAANAHQQGVTPGEPPRHRNTSGELPPPSRQHQGLTRMQAQLLQEHPSSRPPDQHHVHRHWDRRNPYPQDQGAGIHDPGVRVRDRCTNAGADAIFEARTNPRTDEFPAAARHGGGNHPGYPVDGHRPPLSALPPTEAAHGAPMFTRMRSSEDRSDSVSDVTDSSDLIHPSGIPSAIQPQQQQRPSSRRDDSLDRDTRQARAESQAAHIAHTRQQVTQERETRQAVAESQAAHIAHTRQQVTQEIQFRKTLELATNEIARADCQAGAGDSDAQGVMPQSQKTLTEDEANLVQTIRQSILDERHRKIEAEKKYALELEFVLKHSEELVLDQKTEEAGLKESEEELLQGVVAKSRAEAEAELQKEEELLQAAFAQSLEKKAKEEKEREREDELLRRMLAQSLADNAAEKDCMKQYEEEQLRWAMAQSLGGEATGSETEFVEEGIRESLNEGTDWEVDLDNMLKLSLEEKEHIDEKEREQLKKAMESSKSG